MMYATGKSMWANVSVPNTRFDPHKYMITLLTDEDTARELEDAGLTQTKDRAGNLKYDEPAFSFSKTATRKKKNPKYDPSDPESKELEIIEVANSAPKLMDADGVPLDCLVGNGSNVTVKIRPYSIPYGTFAELVAVKVNELVEYGDIDSDNEEF